MSRPPAAAETVDRAEFEAYAAAVAAAAGDLLPGYTSIIWKGSTFKPWDGPYDFLPGLSDLDIHVYRAGGPGDPFALRRRLLERIGPAPCDVPLQLLVLDTATLPDWWTLVPGTYRVVAGEPPPFAVPSTELLLERDRHGLAEARAHAEQVGAGVMTKHDEELWSYLRGLRWMFPPVLFRAVSLCGVPPEEVWAMNRTRVLEASRAFGTLDGVRRSWVAYLDAALAACVFPGSPPEAEAALRAGESLLRVAHEWVSGRPDRPVDRRQPTWWMKV